jgi:diguanylate cyclase (GGDEF)-like protein
MRLQKELEELSYRDGITGVFNRRMFDSVLETEWANAQYNRQPLSLILLDIDYFKQYNDHYGHIQGDDCLKLIGKILSAAGTRSRDFFARFGGEEFVLVLPEADEKAAHIVAERCRELILKAQISHEKSQVNPFITVSIGIGTITPTQQDKSLAFIKKVDKRLYQAKKNGRNCIVEAN